MSKITFINPKQIVIICSVACLSASAQPTEFIDPISQPIEWLSPIDSVWSELANWTNRNVPNRSLEDAVINVPGEFSIDVDSSFSIGSLFLTNPDVTLMVDGRASFTVNERFVNYATIILNPDGLASNAQLRFGHDSILFPPGEIILNAQNEPLDAQLRTIFSSTVTNGLGHTIRGAGHIEGTFVNHGDIVSQGSNGVGMRFFGSITQGSTGRVSALGTQLVFGENASLVGGELRLDSESTLVLNTNSFVRPEFVDVDRNAILRVVGAASYPFPGAQVDRIEILGNVGSLILSDSFVNDGDIILNADNAFGGSSLVFAADNLELAGTGRVVMQRSSSSNTPNEIRTDGDFEVVITEDQIIEGHGRIYADQGGSFKINGTVRTIGPEDILTLNGPISGGLYEADQGVIRLGSGLIENGIFTTTNGGRIEMSGNPLLKNAQIISTGGLKLRAGNARFAGFIGMNGPIVADQFIGSIDFDISTQLLGHGEIIMRGTESHGSFEITGDLTLPPTFTLSGSGWIRANVINQSVITANDPVRPLQLVGLTQGGTFLAENGILRSWGTHMGGSFIARDGLIELGTAEFHDAEIWSEGGGDIQLITNGLLELNDSSMHANLHLTDESDVLLVGATELIGDHLIEDESTMRLSSHEITGTGIVRLFDSVNVSGAPKLHIGISDGGFGPGYQICGSGIINGPPINGFVVEGSLIADDDAKPLRLRGGIGPVNNFVADGGVFLFERDSNIIESTMISINGGRFETADNGLVTLTRVENNTDFHIIGNGEVIIQDYLINNGTLLIETNAPFPGALVRALSPAVIGGAGVIYLQSAEGLLPARIAGSVQITIGPEQTVTGAGRLGGTILLAGTIDPIRDEGEFVVGQVEMTSDAKIILDLADPIEALNDQLSSSFGGGLHLDGTLVLRFFGEYEPRFGDRWEFMSNGNNSGVFSSILADGIELNGRVFRTIITDDGIDLILTCLGDRNGDFQRDFFDVIDFIAGFSALSNDTDLNQDGIHNFFDVSLFLQRFNAVCTDP